MDELLARMRVEMATKDAEVKNKEDQIDAMTKDYKELRETFNKETKVNQEEICKVYDDKIKNLQDALDEEKVNKAGREQEVLEMVTKLSALTSSNIELEESNASFQKRMIELQAEMDKLLARMRTELASKDEEVKNKDEKIFEQLQFF